MTFRKKKKQLKGFLKSFLNYADCSQKEIKNISHRFVKKPNRNKQIFANHKNISKAIVERHLTKTINNEIDELNEKAI